MWPFVNGIILDIQGFVVTWFRVSVAAGYAVFKDSVVLHIFLFTAHIALHYSLANMQSTPPPDSTYANTQLSLFSKEQAENTNSINNGSPVDNTETQRFRHTYTSMHRNSHTQTQIKTSTDLLSDLLSFLLKLANVCRHFSDVATREHEAGRGGVCHGDVSGSRRTTDCTIVRLTSSRCQPGCH